MLLDINPDNSLAKLFAKELALHLPDLEQERREHLASCLVRRAVLALLMDSATRRVDLLVEVGDKFWVLPRPGSPTLGIAKIIEIGENLVIFTRSDVGSSMMLPPEDVNSFITNGYWVKIPTPGI